MLPVCLNTTAKRVHDSIIGLFDSSSLSNRKMGDAIWAAGMESKVHITESTCVHADQLQ